MKKYIAITVALFSLCMCSSAFANPYQASPYRPLLQNQSEQIIFFNWGSDFSVEADWNLDGVADDVVYSGPAQSSSARQATFNKTFTSPGFLGTQFRVDGGSWVYSPKIIYSSDPNAYKKIIFTLCQNDDCSWNTTGNVEYIAMALSTVAPQCSISPGGVGSGPGDAVINNAPGVQARMIGCDTGLLPSEPTITGATTAVAGSPTGVITATTYDIEGQTVMLDVDWNGDGSVDGTTGYFPSGTAIPIGNTFTTPGTYTVKVRSRDSTGMISAWSTQTYSITVTTPTTPNAAPNTPTLGGTTTIERGDPTANTVVATDPDNNTILYELDWDGNGTVDGTTSAAVSGTTVNISTTYTTVGVYQVKARAVDSLGLRSGWSAAYPITVTSNGTPNTPTLGGTEDAVINIPTGNTIVATDPDGDQVF